MQSKFDSLFAHFNDAHIVASINYDGGVDVVLVVDVQLMGGGDHQMAIAQGEVNDALWKLEYILGAIRNVLHGNALATRARCLQVARDELLLHGVDYNQLPGGGATGDLSAIRRPGQCVKGAHAGRCEACTAVGPLKRKLKT